MSQTVSLTLNDNQHNNSASDAEQKCKEVPKLDLSYLKANKDDNGIEEDTHAIKENGEGGEDYERQSNLSLHSSAMAAMAAVHEKLTLFETGLALVSVNIGGGIVGIPFAFQQAGVPIGVAVTLLISFVSWLSTLFLLKSKDLCPQRYESMYEIGYLVLGRSAIFIIAGSIIVANLGLVAIYYIVFGNSVATVTEQAFSDKSFEEIQAGGPPSRTAPVIFAATILLPVLFMKELAEMKFLSYCLFGCVTAFIMTVAFDLYTDGAKDHDIKDFLAPQSGNSLITAISILSVAFYYITGVFPAYSSQSRRSTVRFGWSTLIANIICLTVYISLGVLCLMIFGQNLKSDVLLNIASRPGAASICLRTIFSLVLLMHIPYTFFPLKEGLLVLYDELARRSISSHLQEKIDSLSCYRKHEGQLNEEDGDVEPLIAKSDGGHSCQSQVSLTMSEVSELAYKAMDNRLYVGITLSLHIFAVASALLVDDISYIFDFIATFGISFLMFLVPALMMLLTQRNFGSEKYKKTWEALLLKVGAVFVILVGAAVFALGLYTNVQTIRGKMETSD